MNFELEAFFFKTLEFEEEKEYSETMFKFVSSKISVMSERNCNTIFKRCEKWLERVAII